MDRKDVLQSLKFEGVAEKEVDLGRYFVRTNIFDELVEDRWDLVLGHKGSGKTALFKILADESYGIAELANVDVIAAFDLHQSLQFRQLAEPGTQVTVGAVSDSWRTYIAVVAGNHLVDNYESRTVSGLSELLDSLEPTGLRDANSEKRKRNLFSRLFAPDPVKIHPARSTLLTIDSEDVSDILDEIRAVLRTLGKQCWVVFDRLDEAFSEKPTLERVAVHALMDVIRECAAPGGEVKVKAFLRDDIFSRVSGGKSRLVNSSHVHKTQIAWPKDVMVDLICRRLADSRDFMTEFRFSREDLRSGNTRMKMIAALLPSNKPPQSVLGWPSEGLDTLTWLLKGTAFGGAQYSPRNVLSFLDQARRCQLEWHRLNLGRPNGGPQLLSGDSLARAAVEVSRLRYDDTLLAEFPEVYDYLPKLRGGPSEFETRDQLAFRIGLGNNDTSFKPVLDLLHGSGVVESLPNQRYGIARVYRPALEVG